MKKSNKNSKAMLFAFKQNDNSTMTVKDLEAIKTRYSGESQIFDLKKLSYSNGLSHKPDARILILRDFDKIDFSEMENLVWEKKTDSIFSSLYLKPAQSIPIEFALKSLAKTEFKTLGFFYRVSRKVEIKNNQSNFLFHVNESGKENHLIFNWYVYGIMTAQEITIPIFSGDLCILCNDAKKYNDDLYELRYYFHNY